MHFLKGKKKKITEPRKIGVMALRYNKHQFNRNRDCKWKSLQCSRSSGRNVAEDTFPLPLSSFICLNSKSYELIPACQWDGRHLPPTSPARLQGTGLHRLPAKVQNASQTPWLEALPCCLHSCSGGSSKRGAKRASTNLSFPWKDAWKLPHISRVCHDRNE